MNPVYERFDVEVSRADAVYGRDHATEDMIQTIVLCGIFDGHDITDIFHDTDDVAVALRTAAYRALFVVGNIMTRSAKTDLRSEPVERLGELQRQLFLFPHQVQHKTQGGLLPYARQPGNLIDRFFNQP